MQSVALGRSRADAPEGHAAATLRRRDLGDDPLERLEEVEHAELPHGARRDRSHEPSTGRESCPTARRANGLEIATPGDRRRAGWPPEPARRARRAWRARLSRGARREAGRKGKGGGAEGRRGSEGAEGVGKKGEEGAGGEKKGSGAGRQGARWGEKKGGGGRTIRGRWGTGGADDSGLRTLRAPPRSRRGVARGGAGRGAARRGAPLASNGRDHQRRRARTR